ncbi:MAG: hypothetical protein KME30_13475 [Iphinoe sp. HA4291-MV1]|nr:hypothetical protein [Iphinoe sp. HA4291-MV1]
MFGKCRLVPKFIDDPPESTPVAHGEAVRWAGFPEDEPARMTVSSAPFGLPPLKQLPSRLSVPESE